MGRTVAPNKYHPNGAEVSLCGLLWRSIGASWAETNPSCLLCLDDFTTGDLSPDSERQLAHINQLAGTRMEVLEAKRELAEARALLAEGVAVVEKAERERDAYRAAAMAAMGLLQQLREAGKLPKWAKENFKQSRDEWLDATKEKT
jgi:hypothetical protein